MVRSEGYLRLFLLLVLLALPLPALADKPIIVGDGTAAGCTEAAVVNALAVAASVGGGTIKFHCGSGPVSILVTTTLVIPDNTTIDGDGTITLVGAKTPLFAPVLVALVRSNTTVTLKSLVISGEPCFFGDCQAGGVLNEGTLTVRDTTFADNVVEFFGSLQTAALTNWSSPKVAG